MLTVNLNRTVYDERGNLTKTDQSNNTARLTDKLLPFFTGGALTPSNASVSVTFNEKVYAKKMLLSVEVSDLNSRSPVAQLHFLIVRRQCGIVGNTSLGLPIAGLHQK